MMENVDPQQVDSRLPREPVDRVLQPLARFLHIESASGLVLLACTIVALFLANSPWAESFKAIWELHFRIGFEGFELNKPLHLWINDGLMTIFFFVVGLEIKREIVAGELRDPRRAALPAAAALGGMFVPALIYFSLQHGGKAEAGWGIPMATDIAFVVGFLAIFGSRVPLGLKILLLALAIVDDIGAILVIAIFYSSDISFVMLGLAFFGFLITFSLRVAGVRSIAVYYVVGACVWVCVLKSGIHPTVAGVLLGLMTPSTPWLGQTWVLRTMDAVGNLLTGRDETPPSLSASEQRKALSRLELAARESVSPLERLENALHPWVAFVIMPIFALANAGVTIHLQEIANPIGLAVAAGLVLGKPIGIVLFSWIAVQLRVASLPTGVGWKAMIGGGCLAGIGFTMSLFIAELALKEELLDSAKIGVLLGSTTSAILGSIILLTVLRKDRG